MVLSNYFKNQVDELIIVDCPKDPELAEAFRWLNDEARKYNFDIYEMVNHVLIKGESIQKARDWMKSR